MPSIVASSERNARARISATGSLASLRPSKKNRDTSSGLTTSVGCTSSSRPQTTRLKPASRSNRSAVNRALASWTRRIAVAHVRASRRLLDSPAREEPFGEAGQREERPRRRVEDLLGEHPRPQLRRPFRFGR